LAASGPLETDNRDNTVGRWQKALEELQAEPPLAPPQRVFDLDVIVALDVSGSMDGLRITAVKLGLCCLLGALRATDRVRLLTFGSEIRDVTGTAVSATELLPMLPGLLAGIRADGGTRFYDAILACFDLTTSFGYGGDDSEGATTATAPMTVGSEVTPDATADVATCTADPTVSAAPAATRAPSTAPPARRTVILTLTDGEDSSSEMTVGTVQARVRRPEQDHLMFITVTVDVHRRILTMLEPWFVYSHTKRLDVTVRTGRQLVAVFAEIVLLRMLRDKDDSSVSFYSRVRGPVLRDGCVDPPLETGAPAVFTPMSPRYSLNPPACNGSGSDSSSVAEDDNGSGGAPSRSRPRSSRRSARRVRARVAAEPNVPSPLSAALADDGDDEIDNNGCYSCTSPAYACYNSD
jgi:hypothetical protein